MKQFDYDLGLSKLQELRDNEIDPLTRAEYQRDIDNHFFGNMKKRKNKKERKKEKRRERMRLREEEDY
jgi:hypothetical protein